MSMNPPTDITDDHLIIERADHKNVFVYYYDRNGYNNNHAAAAEYKNRTSVSEEDLIRGVLDLEIRNLSLKDSGLYRVSSIDHRTNCTFNISVAAKVDGADEGPSQTETLKTVLLATVVPVFFILVAAFGICLCRSNIRKVWSRVRDRQGPDPDRKVEFRADCEPQVTPRAAHEC